MTYNMRVIEHFFSLCCSMVDARFSHGLLNRNISNFNSLSDADRIETGKIHLIPHPTRSRFVRTNGL